MNILFLQRHDQSQKFWAKLVKNWQKIIQKTLVFTALDILQLKKVDDYENIYSGNICRLIMQTDISKKKMEINT